MQEAEVQATEAAIEAEAAARLADDLDRLPEEEGDRIHPHVLGLIHPAHGVRQDGEIKAIHEVLVHLNDVVQAVVVRRRQLETALVVQRIAGPAPFMETEEVEALHLREEGVLLPLVLKRVSGSLVEKYKSRGISKLGL